MNILITGCNGQLGNELQLLQKTLSQHTWFNTDVAELDITNKEAIQAYVDKNAIDGIINCAAYTNVDKAETDQELCKRINAEAPQYLAEAMAKVKGFMIHVSTDYVFNGTNNRPYVETQETCPNSIYGITKRAGELGVINAGCNYAILRTAWLYSSFGNNFVKTMIRLGKEKDQLGVIFDQIGSPTYARDLAQTILTMIDKGVKQGVYHYSNEGVISWYDFTKAIHRLANITTCNVKPIHTSQYPTAATRPHYSVLDKTKIKETYNITISYWEDSLAECIALLQKQ